MLETGIVAIGSTAHYSAAAAMTFGIPIGTLGLAMFIGFWQRKPLPDVRRHRLFPLSGIPQRVYDLAIINALHERSRRQLIADREQRAAGSERPVGE